MDCCHIALTLAVTNLLSLAIYAGYTINLKARTLQLEKKNGAEQAQLDQLSKELELLKKPKRKYERKLKNPR